MFGNIGKGLLGTFSLLMAVMFLDLKTMMEGVGFIAVVVTGPIVFVVYMRHISKSNQSDFDAMSPGNRLAFFGTIGLMLLSTSAVFIYLANNPALIWS